MISAWVSGYPCQALGNVSGIEWSTIWDIAPSGCHEASWRIDMDPNEHHPELSRGRPVVLKNGAHGFWSGYVRGVERDENGWVIRALGYASMAATDFKAYDANGNPTSRPRDAVYAAVARGLPWRVSLLDWPATSYDPVSTLTLSKDNSLADLLNAYCESTEQRWTVRGDRALRFESARTSPDWVARPGVGVMGVADDSYLTHLRVRYISAIDANGRPTYALTPVSAAANDAAALKWGRRERTVDRSGIGVMTETAASNHARKLLNRVGPRMGWSDALTVDLDDLTDATNLRADPTAVEAGHRLRIHGVYDVRGALTAGPNVEVNLAEVKASAEAESVYLAPVGLVARDIESILSDVPYDADKSFEA